MRFRVSTAHGIRESAVVIPTRSPACAPSVNTCRCRGKSDPFTVLPNLDEERPRGILTDKDRAYLLGEEIPDSKQARYQRREAIRERVANGILDFQFLWRMNPEERRESLSRIGQPGNLYTSLVNMTAFMRYCAMDGDFDLEEILSSGVQQSLYEDGSSVLDRGDDPDEIAVLESATVSIDLKYRQMPTEEALLERFRDGNILGPRELSSIIGSGMMTEEDWDRLREEYGPEE